MPDRCSLFSSDLDLLFPPFFPSFLFPLSKKTKTKNSLELVPRTAVLSAHAHERALGLGDGDVEAYKAFVVECALFFIRFFFPLSNFPLFSFALSFLTFFSTSLGNKNKT